MRWLATLTLAIMAACGGSPSEKSDGARSEASDRAHAPEVWQVGAEPLVSIGVVEGEEPYQLHDASSSVRLPDGRLAVVNGGSAEVRFFDREGRFLGSFGQDGDGPGEFRSPTRIQYLASDTLRIWDQRLNRFSFHDVHGAYARVERLERGDEPFPGDVWLYDRNLVDSPVPPAARGPLIEGLRALPPVDSLLSARYVRVTEQGRFWVSDARIPADSAVTWAVYELDGSPTATITLPAHFEPHDIGHDYVLGRWFDYLNVNYIRMYALEKPEGSPAGQGLVAVRSAPDRPAFRYAPADVPDEVPPMLRSLFKNIASLQEINYSKNMTYSTDLTELEIVLPQGVRVDFLEADPRGWTGVVTHRPTGVYCILTYGGHVPMGWQPGAVICPGL